MKKFNKIIIVSLLTFACLPTTALLAKDISTEAISEQYLKEKNVTSTSELSREDELELFKKVDKIKSEELKRRQQSSKFRVANPYRDYAGDIFVTMDNKTYGFRHGHAGIGVNSSGDAIEANPRDGVKYYPNRIRDYWSDCATGGVMAVHNAKSHHYSTALNYARRMVGKRYGFNAVDTDEFYCSELVYYAWKSAGFDIASGRGALILPIDIIKDDDTHYVRKWR